MDVTQTPYAEFLEHFIESIMELKPTKVGVCLLGCVGDTSLTGYLGECCPEDKAVMAYHINSDAILDTVKANARDIIQAAEEQEE